MKNILFNIKKIGSPFFNTKAAGLYFILFATAIGVATFIENDFGTIINISFMVKLGQV